MKLSTLSYLVVGAGLLQVSATPMRVVLVSGNQEASTNLRFGHAMGSANQDGVNLLGTVQVHQIEAKFGRPRDRGRGCSRFHQKAIEFSNTFRQALGLPVIETEFKSDDGKTHGGAVRIMPFIGTPPVAVEMTGEEGMIKGGDKVQFARPARIHHHHGPIFHHASIHKESFMRRLHIALMTLGPWEGRAIAFVLGCGIGVLLRMVWVLVIVSYRAIRGHDEEDDEYTLVPNQYDAEEIFVAPPQYYVDEKVPLAEEKPVVHNTN